MELAKQTYKDLTELIHAETGIVLGTEKAYLIRHRLEPLIHSEKLTDFDDLIQQLRSRKGTALRDLVIDAITVKETRFFRDQNFFDALLEHVLPACAQSLKNGRHRLRIWSAAASTGQEVYSLAMLVREFLASGASNGLKESQIAILATDISTAAIDTAKSARYTNTEVHRGVSEARLSQHFKKRGELWCVDESLARMVQFRTFNLLTKMDDVGAFDLILCRNVMIYFDEASRRKVCRALYGTLQKGGWLALGSAESLYGMEDQFETVVQGKTILYRKPAR